MREASCAASALANVVFPEPEVPTTAIRMENARQAQRLRSSDNASTTAPGASCGRKCPATGTTRR